MRMRWLLLLLSIAHILSLLVLISLHKEYRSFSFRYNTVTQNSSANRTHLPHMDLCSSKHPELALVGRIAIQNIETDIEIQRDFISALTEESFPISDTRKTRNCTSASRVLLIIPYRDRWTHLIAWLKHHIPILNRQQLAWRIFITEQHGNGTFNKGRIMNAAYKEAKKLYQFDCVLFHDVDMVLEDDRNLYSCPEKTKHLSPSVDELNYTLPYTFLIGGAIIFPNKHFEQVNGYSNEFWGWGGEDDDMYKRLVQEKIFNKTHINRSSKEVGRYTMLKHQKRNSEVPASRMAHLLRTSSKRYNNDGLNSVEYRIVSKTFNKLFTHFVFDIGEMPKTINTSSRLNPANKRVPRSRL